LRPSHDQVRILSDTLVPPISLIDIRSGNNAIFGMTMEVNTTAVSIATGPEAGGNTISHNRIVAVTPLTSAALIEVESGANLIEANALLGPQTGHADTAISVEETAGNHIAMNVIFGPFMTGVKVSGTGSGSGNVTKIDHNSINLVSIEGNTGTGVLLDTVPKLCYRNNIVYRTATGLSLTSVSLASDGECDGFAAGRNVNVQYLDRCVSSEVPSSLCLDLCGSATTPGPMCDVDADPMWDFDDAFLCLLPSSSLVNEGEDVMWDMWDAPGTPDYYEQAPEIGAREFGVQRNFGGQISICE
jgi:hypothetical protein